LELEQHWQPLLNGCFFLLFVELLHRLLACRFHGFPTVNEPFFLISFVDGRILRRASLIADQSFVGEDVRQ